MNNNYVYYFDEFVYLYIVIILLMNITMQNKSEILQFTQHTYILSIISCHIIIQSLNKPKQV